MLHKKVVLWMGLVLVLLCWGLMPAAAQTNDVEDWLQQFCADAGAELPGCQYQTGQTAAAVQDIAQELTTIAQTCAAEVEAGNLTPADCGAVMAIYGAWLVDAACYEGEQANGTIPVCQAREAIQARFQDSSLYESLTYCAETTNPQECVKSTLLFSVYLSTSLVCGLAEDTHPLPACDNLNDLVLAISQSELPQKIEQCQAWVENGQMTEQQCKAYVSAFATVEMYTYCGITSDDPVRNSPGCQALALYQEGDGLVLATAQTCSEMVTNGEMTSQTCAQLVADSGSAVLSDYCASDAVGTDETTTRLCEAQSFSQASAIIESAVLCARAAQNDWVSPHTCAVMVTQQMYEDFSQQCAAGGANDQDPFCQNLNEVLSNLQDNVQLEGDILSAAVLCKANTDYTPEDCRQLVAIITMFEASENCYYAEHPTPGCDGLINHLDTLDGDFAATLAYCAENAPSDPDLAKTCGIVLAQVLAVETMAYCGYYEAGDLNVAPGCEALSTISDLDGDMAQLTALCTVGVATGMIDQASCEYLMTEAVTVVVTEYCSESPQHQALCDQVGSGEDLQRVMDGCASGEITGDSCSALKEITDQVGQQRDSQSGNAGECVFPPPPGMETPTDETRPLCDALPGDGSNLPDGSNTGSGGNLPTPQPEAPRPTLPPPDSSNGGNGGNGGNLPTPQPPSGGGDVQPPQPPADGGGGGVVEPPPQPPPPPPPPDGGGAPQPPGGGGGGRGG